jgi:hypothetical protein
MADVDINLRVKSDDAPVKSTALKFTELASKVQLAQQAFAVIKRVADEVIGSFTTYAKTVEDMARVTGSGAEETSRLIQVADDLQISTTDLSTALAGAVRKGINPSVESIAALSDEYLALAPGLERSKFLMDNFGRSGLAMARLMEQGGDAIQAMGAAVDDSLIITEDGIKAAQDYALALDTLNDRVEGAKMAIGSKLVPVLTDAATAAELLFNWQNKLNQIAAEVTTNAEQTATTYKDYALQAIAAAAATGQLDDRQQRIAQSLLDGTMPAEKAAKYTNELAAALDLTDEKTWNAERSTTDLTEALDGTAQIAGDATTAVGDLGLTLDDVKASFGELTKEMIFNAAAENLSATEAMKLGVQMGLVNAETLGYMMSMDELDAALATGQITALEYRDAVAALGQQIEDEANNPHTITVTVHMDDQELNDFMAQWHDLGPAGPVVGALPGGGGQQPEARAAGGPIVAGQPYVVGEEGPELIVPNRDAYVVPHGAGNVYNFYGYNNPTAIAQRLVVLEAFGV